MLIAQYIEWQFWCKSASPELANRVRGWDELHHLHQSPCVLLGGSLYHFNYFCFALFLLQCAPPGGRLGFVGSQLWCQDEQLRLQWFSCCRELLRHRQDLAFQLPMFQGVLLQVPIYKVQFSKFLYAKAKYFWNSYLEPTTCQPPLDEKTADLKPNKTWPKTKTKV